VQAANEEQRGELVSSLSPLSPSKGSKLSTCVQAANEEQRGELVKLRSQLIELQLQPRDASVIRSAGAHFTCFTSEKARSFLAFS
jgi:hypothetical protein